MMSYLIRGLLKDHKVRFLAVNNLDTVRETIKYKEFSPLAMAALGRVMAVGSMMGMMNKEEDAKTSIRVYGDGPLGPIIVDSNTKGEVRGYVKNSSISLPLKPNGHLDVSKGVGKGIIQVVNDIGMNDPFESQIAIQSGEIGDDFSYYFSVSEQTPSVVGVGVLVDVDYSLKASGGFIVQMLPDATEEDYVYIENIAKDLHSVTDLLLKYDSLEELMKNVFGELEFVESFGISFKCGCHKDNYISALATLKEEEIQEMIKDEGVEIVCNFCGKKHYLDVNDLNEVLEIKNAKK